MSSAAFDFQPTLVGPRVTVRPIEPADWDGMFAAARDPGIWELHPAPDRYQEGPFREYFDDAIACGMAFTFVDHSREIIIGSSRFNDYDPAAGEIEIGWTFLSRDYWGGSYNAEIKKLMLDHAFQFVDTVLFWVGEANLRSRGAMEKIGGVLRDGSWTRMYGTEEHPYLVYEIQKGRTTS